jgi:hypothetical protein
VSDEFLTHINVSPAIPVLQSKPHENVGKDVQTDHGNQQPE